MKIFDTYDFLFSFISCSTAGEGTDAQFDDFLISNDRPKKRSVLNNKKKNTAFFFF